jgi:hypothetical protein
MASSSSSIPPSTSDLLPEYEKWDHSIEAAVRKSATGAAIGTAAAIFARTNAGRLSMAAFGLCFGAGMAWREASYLFDYDIAFDRRHVVAVNFYPDPQLHAAATDATSNKQ